MHVTVDHDPLVWLRGPDVDAAADDRQHWLAGALDAYSQGYELDTVEGGDRLRDYVGRVLEVFSRWESPAQLRFLRVRHLADEFIPVGVEFYGRQQREDVELQFPGSDFATEIRRPDRSRHLVGETSLEEVAAAPGWQRLFYSVQGDDGAVYCFVRYVRHFVESDVTVVIRFGGDSPAVVVGAIPDADRLAASIDVSGEAA